MLDADEMTTGQLLGQTLGYNDLNYVAKWKVDGIKIERTRARNFFLQTDRRKSVKREFFYSSARYSKTKKDIDGP